MLPVEYIFALVCALIYAFGTLLSKRAFSEGVGVARTLFLFNWIQFAYFLPFVFFVDTMPDWSQWLWPLLAGLCFFFGQLTTFTAIRIGDVSVQTPIMGTKMVFVAAFSTLLGAGAVPLSWWWGAFMGMVGVFLLSGLKFKQQGNVWISIALALLSAACYGLCDVLVSQHAKDFSPTAFPIVMMGVNAVLSFTVIPFFRGGYGEFTRTAWIRILSAGFTLTTQGTLLYWTLSHYGKATAINILYSSRGIWSVVLVWGLGAWFANQESQDVGNKTMSLRFLGATLMLVSIFLVLQG